MDRRSVLMRAAVLGGKPRIPMPATARPVPLPAVPRPTEVGTSTFPLDAVRCDQAIFTSIRSPMGEGYRLVAVSPGLRPEEKAEITRRSPSHGSLCDERPGATALLSYRLDTGRQVVACSSAAGQEHTGRGGCRVYTHLAVLSPHDYQTFHCNPVLVSAMLTAVLARTGPCLAPPPRLDPILLAPVRNPADFPRPCIQTAWLWTIASQLLTGSPTTILTGLTDPRTWLAWLWFCLPRETRALVDVSVGLRYAPGRQMRLVVLPDQFVPRRGLPTGEDTLVHDALCPPPEPPPECEPWLRLLRRWWQERRHADLIRLTSEVCPAADQAALPRLAALCEDLDRARAADPAARHALAGRYTHFTADLPVERQLADQILAACAS